VTGIMLILLASFILGVVSYVISIIPEYEITTSGQLLPGLASIYTELLYQHTYGWSGGFSINWNIGTTITTDNNYNWIIATYSTSGYNSISGIGYGVPGSCTWGTKLQYNESVGYIVLPAGVSFSTYCLSTNTGGTYTTYIIKADKSVTPDKDLQAFFYKLENPQDQSSTSTTSLSNKVILAFIGWFSGIALIITALHKMDIWI
jgi:hypothetical protein